MKLKDKSRIKLAELDFLGKRNNKPTCWQSLDNRHWCYHGGPRRCSHISPVIIPQFLRPKVLVGWSQKVMVPDYRISWNLARFKTSTSRCFECIIQKKFNHLEIPKNLIRISLSTWAWNFCSRTKLFWLKMIVHCEHPAKTVVSILYIHP